MAHPIKRLLVIFPILGLAACATAAETPSSLEGSSYDRYVVERDMVVRQAANAGGTEIGKLPAGAELTARVEHVGGNWYRLHSSNGNIGYIFGKPLRRTE